MTPSEWLLSGRLVLIANNHRDFLVCWARCHRSLSLCQGFWRHRGRRSRNWGLLLIAYAGPRTSRMARHLSLPDWVVFSGAVYQPVLNHLTGRPLDYASATFAVGVRLEPDDRLHIEAPFRLADLFALRLRPNPRRKTVGFARTAADVRRRWPELVIDNEP
jgi:hypothetical protein